MKPAAFKYVATHSLDEALALKAEHGDEASFLAGGQSLVPAMNYRLATPAMLIDINPLAELDDLVYEPGGGLRLGALLRHRRLELDRGIGAAQPLIHQAIAHVAHAQIRNRGTLGGNLANADPTSELPAVVLALDGVLVVQSLQGKRRISAEEFFIGPLTTALRADELLISVELPAARPRTGACFMEVARRRGDFALMGVAATVTLDESGTCSGARLAYCGAADRPLELVGAAQCLVGSPVSTEAIAASAAMAQSQVQPLGSIHAGKEFQRHLAGVLARRALHAAAERAQAALPNS
jgi:carbon-monoxide dehydrogenase medium subunit